MRPCFTRRAILFEDANALESYADGGLLIRDGRVAGCGDYSTLRDAHPRVPTVDLRGGFLLPGFIDTHIHFPQLRVLGGLGRSLLDWLEHCALPEEARMADHAYACRVARDSCTRWLLTEQLPLWCLARTSLPPLRRF